jgi:hypothetical protein
MHMSRQAIHFVLCLLPSALAVGFLVAYDQTVIAVLAGVAGILVHWWLTSDPQEDGELADSSYFFGFLLTLVFLVVGLYRLGSVTAGTASTTTTLLQFLDDLAAGLFLTIVGLGVRQVRTLSSTTRGVEDIPAWQRELTSAMNALVEALRTRPEAQVAHELEQARSRARESVDRFDQNVSAAARRMGENIGTLEAAVTDATNAIQRTSAQLGASMSEAMHRIESELGHVLGAMQKQRQESENAMRLAQDAAAEMRVKADEQLSTHTAMWQESLERARDALVQTHRTLDEEYRRGVTAFAETGTRFRELSEATVTQVNALPNPADRLAGLWDGVRNLESELTEAIDGAVRELGNLRERAEHLSYGLTSLAGSADEAASGMTAGGARLGDALHRELQQMNRIIEEYTSLLEKTTRTLAARK